MKTRINRGMKQLHTIILRGLLATGMLVLLGTPQMTATADAQHHFFMDKSYNAAAVLAEQQIREEKVKAVPVQQNVQERNAAEFRVVSEREQERFTTIQDTRLREKSK